MSLPVGYQWAIGLEPDPLIDNGGQRYTNIRFPFPPQVGMIFDLCDGVCCAEITKVLWIFEDPGFEVWVRPCRLGQTGSPVSNEQLRERLEYWAKDYEETPLRVPWA